MAFGWDGEIFLNPIEKENRGTEIIVHLKDEEKEYTEKSRIQSIIKKYSNFVSFPIMVCGERANQITAIWKEPKKEIKEEQYNEFYKFISNTEDTPLFRLHTSAEAPIQFSSILYCPSTNYETYGFKKLEHGVHLYSNKILIQPDCKMLLPRVHEVYTRRGRLCRYSFKYFTRNVSGQQDNPQDEERPC